MNASLKFKHISKNLIKLIIPLLDNQAFLRYVKYLDGNPIDENRPDIDADIIGDQTLILQPFNQTTLTETQIKLFLNPKKGSLSSKPLGIDTYGLDIIVPLNLWVIQSLGELRAFSIAYEIAKVIDGQNVAGIGDVEIVDWIAGKMNEHYGFLTLFIEVKNATIKG